MKRSMPWPADIWPSSKHRINFSCACFPFPSTRNEDDARSSHCWGSDMYLAVLTGRPYSPAGCSQRLADAAVRCTAIWRRGALATMRQPQAAPAHRHILPMGETWRDNWCHSFAMRPTLFSGYSGPCIGERRGAAQGVACRRQALTPGWRHDWCAVSVSLTLGMPAPRLQEIILACILQSTWCVSRPLEAHPILSLCDE